MKLTRHNGRAGKNGAYNPKHNDRRFDIENSEHIDVERAKQNIYWDCYTGLSSALTREKDKQDFPKLTTCSSSSMRTSRQGWSRQSRN